MNKKLLAAVAVIIITCMSLTYAFSAYNIVDDQDSYDPRLTTQTTTAASTSTTKANTKDSETTKNYQEDFRSAIDGAIQRIDSGLSSFISNISGGRNNNAAATTAAQTTRQVIAETTTMSAQYYGLNTYPTQAAQASQTEINTEEETTAPSQINVQPVAGSTQTYVTTTEAGTVAAVEDTGDKISGGTLTVIVFAACIIILILVIILVLVLLTRKTSFDSKVLKRSTLPGAKKPDEIDISEPDDGEYSDFNVLDNKNKENKIPVLRDESSHKDKKREYREAPDNSPYARRAPEGFVSGYGERRENSNPNENDTDKLIRQYGLDEEPSEISDDDLSDIRDLLNKYGQSGDGEKNEKQ